MEFDMMYPEKPVSVVEHLKMLQSKISSSYK
jgi:hypothetical protein